MDNIQPIVNTEPVIEAPVSEDIKTQEQEDVTTEEVISKAPGTKTDPALLLKSLKDEREKRKLLEDEIEKLKSSALSDEVMSDEGRALDNKIKSLTAELATLKTDSTKKDLLILHPVLKDKWSEFEEFLSNPDNKGMNMKTAAKAFLVENGLLEPRRIGLEKPTSGTRTPIASGMTNEEIKHLRETDYNKYIDLLSKGLIKFES